MNNTIGKSLSMVIKLYQVSIGTLFAKRCRFYPSCSEYSRQSFIKHGAIMGLVKSTWRLLRCNPWNQGGFDPS